MIIFFVFSYCDSGGNLFLFPAIYYNIFISKVMYLSALRIVRYHNYFVDFVLHTKFQLYLGVFVSVFYVTFFIFQIFPTLQMIEKVLFNGFYTIGISSDFVK